jgi:outer membrane murein-binding lipoprotein Lpp
MKAVNKLLMAAIAVSAVFLTSCATFQNFQQFLGTPQAVQSEIAILGGIAKPRLSADAQAKIHQFAVALNEASDLNLDRLYALLPATTGSVNGDALISSAKAYITATVQRYGARNPTALAYAHAVANGLLVNF